MYIRLAPPVIVILCACYAWWRLHRALGCWSNETLRLTARALLPWVLAGATALLVAGPIDRGTWQCQRCARLCERT